MIALIGSGNVAHWIAERLRDSKEFSIGQVYSRHLEHAEKLASKVAAQPINDLTRLNPACDVFVFSLKDDAYPEVMAALPFELPVALHTAGAVSQKVFAGYARQYGVLYPLQTFTKQADMRNLRVPLCIEDNALVSCRDKVMRLAAELSPLQYAVSEEQRAVLHLAAVFVCNFSNAMAQVAESILKDKNLDFKMLLPIMRQTLDKLELMSPQEAQTGPAIRKDFSVMQKHLQMLQSEDQKDIYRMISDYIMKF